LRVSDYSATPSFDYWLAPEQISDIYRSAGPVDDAIGVLRDAFAADPARTACGY
jgi:hypothetical protein